MANYGYTVFLKDFMSSGFMKMATNAQKTYGKITQYQDKHQKKVFKGAKSIDGLNARLDQLNKKRGAATAVRDIRKLTTEIHKTKKSLEKLENLPPDSFLIRIRKVRKNLGGMATAAITGIGVIGAYNGLKSLYNLGADAEASRIKFETLLGSAQKAQNMINNINQYANATPFNNKDLKQNAELLLSFGTAQSKVLPTLKMIGDISGGNKEKLASLTLAYAQATSAGKLMGQDLLQMINAGFNPLQVISEKTGKSMAVLKKEMSEGKISAKVLEDAFRMATEKGGRFHGMLKRMSKSSKGLASTLIGGWQTKLASFSEKYLLPTVNKLLKFGLKLMEGFQKLEPPILKFFRAFRPLLTGIGVFISALIGVSKTGGTTGKIISYIAGTLNFLSGLIEIASNGIGTILAVLEPLSPILKRVALGLIGWKIAQTALNLAIWANPIMLIVGGIVLLVGAIVTAYKKVGWFRGRILALWEIIKGFGSILKTYVIDRFKELLQGITGMGKALYLFFTGKWKQAWEVGKKSVDDLVGDGTRTKAIQQAKELGKKASEAYSKGLKQVNGTKSVKTIKQAKGAVKFGIVPNLLANDPQGNLTKDSDLKNSIKNISSGGSKQTNINVSFESLTRDVIFKTQELKQGMNEAQDELITMLTGVLNSVNQMQRS